MENNIIKWKEEPYADLVKYIVDNYHDYLQKLMPNLSKSTAIILKVHGTNHEELSSVHRLYHMIQINMTQHIIKQEVTIFPFIKTYSRRHSEDLLKKIIQKVDSYKSEKDDTKDLLSKLREVTDNYSTPQDGCATYKRTYDMLREFDANVSAHLQLEDEILFHRLKDELKKY